MSRRRLKGKVISDKMEKTVVVAVERVFGHPVYKKQVKATRHFKAHNELGAKAGDEVTIEETRPLSKGKRWRVVAIGGEEVTEVPKVTEEAKAAKTKKKSKVEKKRKRTNK